MDVSAVIERSALQEQERIRFLEQDRGKDAARTFARRTLGLYRSAVVRRSAPAGETLFRLRFIGSYRYLKWYLQPAHEDEGSRDGARHSDGP